MPAYEKYPNKKEMPSRLGRKGNRLKTFMLNKGATKKLRLSRLALRQAQVESSLQGN